MKKQKGITLIALIITIIVMLILVGVTINVALNGGLFEKAETATKQTEEKAILEEMLAMMELTDDGKIDYTKIKDKMILKYDGAAYSYPNITITGKFGTYNYIVSEKEIKIGSKEIKTFDWETVGLIVDTDTDYKFYDSYTSIIYIINFTTDGKLIVKVDGTIVETYDATDEDDGILTIPFTYEGTTYDTTLTMNSNNVDVDAELKDFTTVTYRKVEENTYPIAYGDYNSAMVLQNSSTENYFWYGTYGEIIINSAIKCTIYPCTDISELPTFDSSYSVSNAGNIEYSYALVGDDGSIRAVWLPLDMRWIYIVNVESQYSYYIINSQNILDRNTNVTEEQINSIIQSAN